MRDITDLYRPVILRMSGNFDRLSRLRDRRETVPVDEGEQLERRAGRALLAPLLLADRAGGDIQMPREHGLADALARA